MNNGTSAVAAAALALAVLLAPAASHAASVGLGASVWCAWWDSMAASLVSRFVGSSGIEPEPAAAGGPFLVAQINDTWGLSLSYLYGRFKWEKSSPLLGSSMDARRHDLDVVVSAAVNKYVRLFFGAKYWGYQADVTANVLFLSYGTGVSRHHGGPGLGLGLSLPLGAGFHLMPGVTAVFSFGKLEPSENGIIGQVVGMFVGSSEESAIMYYGLNSTLTLAYTIEKANLTLALGGRFQCLWLYFIEGQRQVEGNDMFGGITFSAMYMFNIPANGRSRS